ncbi:MAG: transglycosylase domain-containing protein, partial [Oscillospiraceae bacterium]|nr:transglycosylase domain-containing protein [Oscillospiraceae bacterium]
YGVRAAADVYFGKELDELTLAECASIIGITNNPSIYSPYISEKTRERNKTRQELVLDEMLAQGYIDEAECRAAKAQTLVFKRGDNTTSSQEVYTYFEEVVISDVLDDLMEQRGVNRDTAWALLQRGGYSIISTMNPDIQQIVDEVYADRENLPKVTGSSQPLQSAIVIVDPYTGHIAALSGGTGEKDKSWLLNRATGTRRPPGSSIKPLSVYAPAMDAGLISPDTKFNDGADIKLSGTTWYPFNDDRKNLGVMSIQEAIVRSRNTISAQTLDLLTPTASFNFMTQKLGFSLNPADRDYAPLSVGQLTNGATVREMASAYTMFPGSGIRTEAISYTKIYDSEGKLIFENTPVRIPSISEQTAYWMTVILHNAVTGGTGAGANLGKMPTAGKTGTTTAMKDRWFCGFTPYYVAAVWTGYDKPEVMHSNVNPASAIFKKIMSRIHAELDVKKFPKPDNTYIKPIKGLDDVDFTIRYETTDGTLIDLFKGTGYVGELRTDEAKEISGYTPVSNTPREWTLGENPAKNILTIQYYYNAPPPSPTPTFPEISYPPFPTESPLPTYEPPIPSETAPPAETPAETPLPTDTVEV